MCEVVSVITLLRAAHEVVSAQPTWRAWNMTHDTLLVWPRSVSTSHALLSAVASGHRQFP